MNLFGRKKVPIKDQVKDWTRGLSREARGLERKIREIRREEAKVKAQIKKLSKDKNNLTAIKILAKGLVQTQKTCDRIYEAKAKINSVNTQLKLNYAQMKVAQTMDKSGEILKAMSALVRLPELQKNCKDLAKQMMRAGVIEEMINDTFEQMEDPDVEELADKEVDKVLFEITQGQLGGIEEIKNKDILKKKQQEEKEAKIAQKQDEDIEDMKKRLAELN
ncbi:hypothetical protein AAMO2058_000736600 [Amorphochlora amoebiformis]